MSTSKTETNNETEIETDTETESTETETETMIIDYKDVVDKDFVEKNIDKLINCNKFAVKLDLNSDLSNMFSIGRQQKDYERNEYRQNTNNNKCYDGICLCGKCPHSIVFGKD